MRKLFILLVMCLMLTGCMASFASNYQRENISTAINKPLTSIDPSCTFTTALGGKAGDESLHLSTLMDQKLKEWNFNPCKNDLKMEVNVKNVAEGGNLTLGILSGVWCGLSLGILPGIAIDNYRMTVVVKDENKEIFKKEYNSSITTIIEIAFIFWGPFVYPIKGAMWEVVGAMADHALYDVTQTLSQRKLSFKSQSN